MKPKFVNHTSNKIPIFREILYLQLPHFREYFSWMIPKLTPKKNKMTTQTTAPKKEREVSNGLKILGL